MPAERLEPPFDAGALVNLLAKMRKWDPYVPDVIYDDLDAVLGEHLPEAATVDELAERLRGTLKQPANIAVADPTFQSPEAIAVRIERARKLRADELPRDYWPALGHLRRLAWATMELLDHLIASNQVRGAE